jgi:hypothetical protein
VGAPLVSEHVAFVRAGGREAGHLLPVPRSRAMLRVLCDNMLAAQDALPVPLAVEHPASLFDWPDPEFDEADFLCELVARTGCQLVVDVANAYVNGRNHGFDPLEFLSRLPLDRIAYVHAAGGVEADGLLHDSHAHALWPAVPGLVEELATRSAIPGVLLERDDDYPDSGELSGELDVLASAWAAGERRRANRPAPRGSAAETSSPTPSACPDDRTRLGHAQAQLLDALVTGTPIPPGFDHGRVSAAAVALRRKRAGAVAKAWPSLARQLGDHFQPAFVEWSRTRPPPARRAALVDGRRFLDDLRLRAGGPLSPAVAGEAVRAKLLAGGGNGRRRLIPAAVGLVRRPAGVVVAVRLPGGRVGMGRFGRR